MGKDERKIERMKDCQELTFLNQFWRWCLEGVVFVCFGAVFGGRCPPL